MLRTGLVSPQRKLNLLLPDHPSNGQKVSPDSDHAKDDVGLPLTPKNVDPAGCKPSCSCSIYVIFHQFTSLLSSTPFFVSFLLPAEGFTRGRSYNIRIDDQVLLRFSPKNSDSTYYFGDMVLKFVYCSCYCILLESIISVRSLQIGGALTFFHGTGKRRCLEVKG